MSIDNATPTQWDNAKKDMVDHPPHYNEGGLECIDYIKQQLGDQFPSYLRRLNN